MSTSSGVNVLRWSALGLGVFYGVWHQSSISARDKLNALNAEYKRKQDLINKAKAEYARLHAPPAPALTSGGPITDPADPNFDLEKLLATQK